MNNSKNQTCQCECNNYCHFKKDYSWNSRKCTCENRNYPKSISDNSTVACDEVIFIMDIVSTKMTSVSINSDDIKVKHKIDCYISHTVLLVIILLLITTIICYYFAKHRSKQKGIDALTI